MGDHIKKLHDLEGGLMDTTYHSKGMRHVESYVTRGITKMKRSSHCMDSISQDVFGMMREAHNKMQNQAHTIEGELLETYARKEQVEADIADRRQVTAANEALERARAELPHAHSLFDSDY